MNAAAVWPSVVIGIPTYNRAASLKRALDSALGQDWPDLRVLISDNASTDGTRALCEAAVAADPRVIYLRHPENRGATHNFLAVFEGAQADLFMWLADDDWLGEGFVRLCADALRTDPGLVLAGGLGRYHDAQAVWRHDGLPMNCTSTHATLRVLQYYRQVDDNAIFYGLMRLDAARRVPLRNCLGSDWLFIAALAWQGRVRTIPGAVVHRSLGGASQSLAKMARALSLPAWQGRVPATITLAAHAARDIWGCPVYENIHPVARRAFGLLVSCWMCAIKPVQELRRRLRAALSPRPPSA